MSRNLMESTPTSPAGSKSVGLDSAASSGSAMLSALLAGPILTDREQRSLVAAAQDGSLAQTLMHLDLGDPVDVDEQQRTADKIARGLGARTLLLQAALGPVLDVAREVGAGVAPAHLIEEGMLSASVSIGRYDPTRDREAFLDWVTAHVRETLRAQVSAGLAPAGVPGTHTAAVPYSGVVAAIRVRAALTGQRLTREEIEVLSLRFGDESCPSLSLTETGQRLGKSRYEVRALEARAIARLRRHPSARRTNDSSDGFGGNPRLSSVAR